MPPRDAAERLAALNRLTYAINSPVEVPAILNELAREARALVDFDRISFALLEHGLPGQVRVFHLDPDGASAEVLAPLRGTIQSAVRARRSIVRTMVDPDTLVDDDPTDQAFKRFGLHSVVCVPLET